MAASVDLLDARGGFGQTRKKRNLIVDRRGGTKRDGEAGGREEMMEQF